MAALTTLAQNHIAYGDHMADGWGWGMLIVMLVVALAVVALVFWLVRSTTPASTAQSAQTPMPMEVLDLRLAEGALTPDEYRERAAILGKK